MKLVPLFESMSSDQVKKIHEKNPKFFSHPRYVKSGVNGGVFDFVLELSDGDDVARWVDGDWVIRKWTNKDGQTKSMTLFDAILSGDYSDVWNSDGYDGDWQSAIDYHIDKDNENLIRGLINNKITELGNDPSEYNDETLQDLIEEFDTDYDIINAIRWTLGDVEGMEYMNYLTEELKEQCESYGEVLQFNDEGVKIKINFKNVVEVMYDKDFDKDESFLETLEECSADPECMFNEMMDDPYGEKPKFNPDDRWYPSVDDKMFNEELKYRLNEI